MMSLWGRTDAAPLCSKEEHWAFEAKLHGDDEAMLIRLAKIRRCLW